MGLISKSLHGADRFLGIALKHMKVKISTTSLTYMYSLMLVSDVTYNIIKVQARSFSSCGRSSRWDAQHLRDRSTREAFFGKHHVSFILTRPRSSCVALLLCNQRYGTVRHDRPPPIVEFDEACTRVEQLGLQGARHGLHPGEPAQLWAQLLSCLARRPRAASGC